MSYTSGIGGPQLSGTSETPSAAGPNQIARTESRSVPGQDVRIGISGSDEAKLSTTAAVIAQAFTGSDVRTGKVTAVQQSIAAGTYNVSSSAVADKLMSSLLQ